MIKTRFSTLDRAIRSAAVRPLRATPFSSRVRRRAESHRAEIDAVAANPGLPTFANTIEALERSGRSLDQVASVFFNLTGAPTNDELQAIEREIAPALARHRSEIYLNEALFKRIDAIKAHKDKLGFQPNRRAFSRAIISISPAPARAPPEAKARLAAIAERLATLATEFGQHVLADEKDWLMLLDEADLEGLPDFVASARASPPTAAIPENMGSLFAIERRAFPAVLRSARSARGRFPRLGRSRREWRSDRQSGDRCGDGAPQG